MTPPHSRGSLQKRVVIVDDHPVVRVGLRQLIDSQEDLRTCGEAATAEEALAIISDSQPDLIIVDLSLPDKSGMDLIRELKANAHLVTSRRTHFGHLKRARRAM